MEIPLLFPPLNDEVTRYLVDAAHGTWSAIDLDRRSSGVGSRGSAGTVSTPSSSSCAPPPPPPPPAHWTAAPSLKGAASVCRLSSSTSSSSASGDDTLLTTVLLDETPWVLVVSIVAADTFTHSIELDLSASAGFQGIARVQAFPNDGGHTGVARAGSTTAIRLVLVDRHGTVLKILLNWDGEARTLQPRHISQHSWTTGRVVSSHAVNPNSLNHARVGFLSSSKVLLALTPFLFTIDIDKGDEVIVWYRGKCLDAMKRRFFSFAGKPEHGNFVDMSPVAALSVAVPETTTSTARSSVVVVVVHTLHSDGQLRRWIVHPHSTTAEPVSLHESRPESLPRQELWGGEDDLNAPMLTSRLYNQDQVYVCAIYVPESQGCHLSVLHGCVSESGSSGDSAPNAGGGLRLSIPPPATALIGMDFDAHSPKCALVAWFHQTPNSKVDITTTTATTTAAVPGGQDEATASGTVCVRYPPSHVSILHSQPDVFPTDDLLDRLVWKERQDIRTLQPLERTYRLRTVEEALHEVDRQFLRYLFRPRNRALTPLRAPSATHIRNALAKTVRSSSTTSRLGSRSIELEVLTVIHERREDDERRVILLTPMTRATPKQPRHRTTRTSTTPYPSTPYPSTPMSARTDFAFATPGAMNLYDSIGREGLDEMDPGDDDDDDACAVLTDDEDDNDDGSSPTAGRSADTAKAIDRHAGRWRQLLLLIWEEEKALCAPLLLTTGTLNPADVAVTVRSGAISIFNPTASMTVAMPYQSTPMGEFDRCAANIMSTIEEDPALSVLLAAVEREHLELVSTIELAIADDRDSWCYGRLNVLAQEIVGRGYQVTDGDWLEDLANASEEDFITALEQASASMLKIHTPLGGSSDGDSRTALTLGCQSRLAICGVTTRNLEFTQRLLLGRCLLLVLEPISQSRAFEASVRMYLHTVAIRWTMAQHVANPRYTSSENATRERIALFSPQKRLSVDTGASGILNSRDNTCVLDAFLIQICQSNNTTNLRETSCPESISAPVLAFSGEAIRTCLRFHPGPLNGTANVPPELGILAPTYTRHPKLQLVLLAPHATFSRLDDEPLVAAERIKMLASALLDRASTEPETLSRKMVAKAFDLLPFDPENEEKSNRHLITLNDTVGAISDEIVVSMVLDYLDRAISAMECIHDEDVLNRSKLYDSLLDSIFHISLNPLVQNWDRAFNSCLKNPNLRQRAINLQFLAGTMVTNGAISELIKLCKSNVNEGIGFGVEELTSYTNLYEIAADALFDLSQSDSFADRLCGIENVPRYHEALYALHVSKVEWKRAAQALDSLYTTSLTSLQQSPSDSAIEIARERRRVLMDDLLVSSLGCLCALSCLEVRDSQFLISGERPQFISTPAALGVEGSPSKRQLGEHPILLSARDVKPDENWLAQYLDLKDLELRSAVVSAVSLLQEDERTDPRLKKVTFPDVLVHGIGSSCAVVDALTSHGYYDHGVIVSRLSTSTRSGQMGGQVFLHESWLDLLCNYLVPMSLGTSNHFAAPTLSQLTYAMDSLSSAPSGGLPPLLVSSRSKKLTEIPQHLLCTYAMTLLRRLTTEYSTVGMPLATKVAETFLRYRTPSGRAIPIPAWLELFLVRGSNPVTTSSRPGIFTKRRGSDQEEGFSGDPSALLTLLSRSGRYDDACRVVSTLLSPTGDETSAAPSRLPETGDVDFVPYDKIDLLWNLIDLAVEQGVIGDKENEQKVLKARQEMERSLEHHFKLLKISEMGQQSARAFKAH